MELYKKENKMFSIYKHKTEYGYDIGIKFQHKGKEYGTFIAIEKEEDEDKSIEILLLKCKEYGKN